MAAPQQINPEGTIPVREAHKLDVEALERYLSRQVDVFKGRIEALLQFKGGQSNPTFYLRDSNGTEFVLRKKPPGKLLPSAHAVDREYRIIKALAGHAPVPKAYDLCRDASIIGTPFYVMEYVRGRILKDPRLPGMSPAQRAAIFDAMNDTLAQLHALDYKALGLEDYGRPGNYFARQVDRWTKQYRTTKSSLVNPAMEFLIQWLPANLPRDEFVSIVHGDYRADNLIFHPTEPRVIAILDWELSTLGNPMADFSFNALMYYMSLDPHGVVSLSPSCWDELGIPTEQMYIDAYCRRSVHAKSISNWPFYLAFSMFRTAAILDGVYERGERGNASDQTALIVGQLAVTFAELAQQVVEGKRASNVSETRAGSVYELSSRTKDYLFRVSAFFERFILPNESVFETQHRELPSRWLIPPILEELKQKARQAGLWNLFLPHESGLSNLEYAPLCEVMGRSFLAPEVFNCSAPDTGNMEVLHLFATPEQNSAWLQPLLDGKIRSAFCMTEPAVASSDATNISCSIQRVSANGKEMYSINGRKWWSSGAGDPRCKVFIVMGKTNPEASSHKQQSMVLVPSDTPGIRVVRPLTSFGYDDAPFGHMEITFTNVLVPLENIILGEGRGFEIAQARLGPGRIHHCMRLIGLAERALDDMLARVLSRKAFGRRIAEFHTIQADIAQSRIDIDSARLLVLKAAHEIDARGAKGARSLIAQIKVLAPNMALRVIDRAIQAHGAAGLSEDFGLARSYSWARCLRLADGPDEVHRRTIALLELQKCAKL